MLAGEVNVDLSGRGRVKHLLHVEVIYNNTILVEAADLIWPLCVFVRRNIL